MRGATQAQQVLGDEPTSESRSRQNVLLLSELYGLLAETAAAAGPFRATLEGLHRHLRRLSYCPGIDYSHQVACVCLGVWVSGCLGVWVSGCLSGCACVRA